MCIRDSRGRGRRRLLDRAKRSHDKNKCSLEVLLEWKYNINVTPPAKDEASYKLVSVRSIVNEDLGKIGTELQGIFMNVTWRIGSDAPSSALTIAQFRKLDIPRRTMRNGIVFVWSEKELLSDIIHAMEQKGFFYIENFAVVMLDSTKIRSLLKNGGTRGERRRGGHKEETGCPEDILYEDLSSLNNQSVETMFSNRDAEYFSKTKKVLLLFRRIESKEIPLELRHQRTCDVVFDVADGQYVNQQAKEYVYRMIETLLPKANWNPEGGSRALKLLELWGNKDAPREGWITVYETS
eukprot:TRINITY_DN0_c1413_g1_i2.p1 TRINITY_DN0_c1413_g1~~TRINITY_DN0_c1413_g1_i2.p1  ORF type:complete len:295 (+),score=44.42 TRINITY_DN0_c1413_g1_i2:2-886(+)